ncbi:MAG: hypothetical protein NTV11_05075 [Rhodocyclales bacterium]|nr:hypothetical protein [Rhodocyclales bacterium]
MANAASRYYPAMHSTLFSILHVRAVRAERYASLREFYAPPKK